MTECSDVQSLLSAFIDGDLDASDRLAVAAHVDGCAACAGIVHDLDALRRAAGSLGAIEPPPRVFATLADHAADRPASYQWLRLAAAVVIVAAGVYAVVRFDRNAGRFPPPAGNPAATVAVEAGGDDWRTMVKHYEEAIAALETVTKRDVGALDPAIATTLRTNLTQVEAAIDQSRAALVTDPESGPARDSLSESLRRKVTVLEATVAVISESPKGEH